MKYVGDVYKTNNYGDLTITEYLSSREVHIKFLGTGYETVATLQAIKAGAVRDRSSMTLFGVGIHTKTGAHWSKVAYVHWSNMIRRVYDKTYTNRRPNYKNCGVSDGFKHYNYFEEWCSKKVGFGNEGWHLDKDILVKGNKVYSEDTCCFVPPEINTLFTHVKVNKGDYPVGVNSNKKGDKFYARVRAHGARKHLGLYDTPEEAFHVYKEAKEGYIKEVANKWRDQIDQRVYDALLNYEVEIND